MKRILPLLVFVFGCGQYDGANVDEEPIDIVAKDDMANDTVTAPEVVKQLATLGLVDIQQVNPDIRVDLRYTSTDNFMGILLYDTLKNAFLQKEIAVRLSNCQKFLDSIKPGYHLLVYDAVRPVNVQQEMWDALDTVPVLNRGKFVSNPKLGSVHNFGAAVDLTIVDDHEVPLDMGAGYDDFRKIAFPSMEAHFLAEGILTAEQVANRKLLRKVMRSQQFSNIPSEWWHFNGHSRISASHKYQLLRTETGKAEWFKITPHPADSINGSSVESLDSLLQ